MYPCSFLTSLSARTLSQSPFIRPSPSSPQQGLSHMATLWPWFSMENQAPSLRVSHRQTVRPFLQSPTLPPNSQSLHKSRPFEELDLCPPCSKLPEASWTDVTCCFPSGPSSPREQVVKGKTNFPQRHPSVTTY
jgi:hypothetical protein